MSKYLKNVQHTYPSGKCADRRKNVNQWSHYGKYKGILEKTKSGTYYILLLYHWSQWKLTFSTAEISMFVVALFSIANFQMSLLPINERMDKEILATYMYKVILFTFKENETILFSGK